jgi:hypothetical protein
MSSAQSPRGCSIKAVSACLTLQQTSRTDYCLSCFRLGRLDMIDSSFCGAMRLASDCSCLSTCASCKLETLPQLEALPQLETLPQLDITVSENPSEIHLVSVETLVSVRTHR